MKTISKYLFFVLTVALTFASCEKTPEREPSPTFDGETVFFPVSSELGLEIDPEKQALEHTFAIVRAGSTGELSVNINVKENTSDIFEEVPATVVFPAGVDTVMITVKFPKAETDVPYTLSLVLDDKNTNPYRVAHSDYKFSFTLAKWENMGETMAVVFDGIVNVLYSSTGHPGWYVPYARKSNADGTFDIRLLNPYTILPEYELKDGEPDYDSPIADEYGLYGGYPYNYPEDVYPGEFNLNIHVDKYGDASFDQFAMGMHWTDGDFYGLHASARGMGKYDKATNCITFAAGTVALGLSGYNDGAFYLGEDNDFIIYLDHKAYQEANSDFSIKISDFEDGFNDEGIEWNEVEGMYERFVTSAFNENGEAWSQKLLNAVDPNTEIEGVGENSEFYNLYMLPDLYAAGFGMAFYYDTVSSKVSIPASKQFTGISVANKQLFIAPSSKECSVETVQIKGVDVTLFHLNISLLTEDGIAFGEYEEQFFFSVEPIKFEVSEFTGSYLASAKPLLDGLSAMVDNPVTLEAAEEANTILIHGLPYADPMVAVLEPNTGVLTIPTQALPDVHDEWEEDDGNGGTIQMSADYSISLLTYTSDGISHTEPLLYEQTEELGLALTDASVAFGYAVYGVNKEDASDAGYFSGYYNMSLVRAAGEPEQQSVRRKAHVDHKNTAITPVKFNTGKQISTSHLRSHGKASHHPAVKSNPIAM